jgi:hypothetical protein
MIGVALWRVFAPVFPISLNVILFFAARGTPIANHVRKQRANFSI